MLNKKKTCCAKFSVFQKAKLLQKEQTAQRKEQQNHFRCVALKRNTPEHVCTHTLWRVQQWVGSSHGHSAGSSEKKLCWLGLSLLWEFLRFKIRNDIKEAASSEVSRLALPLLLWIEFGEMQSWSLVESKPGSRVFAVLKICSDPIPSAWECGLIWK